LPFAKGSSFAQSGRVAKIGLVQSTTGGSAALYGTEQKQAIELAFAEINAAKTLKDITLQAIYADDGPPTPWFFLKAAASAAVQRAASPRSWQNCCDEIGTTDWRPSSA
jgi:ABC-type branched-subunit amino acid transport system substrate-binding protein